MCSLELSSCFKSSSFRNLFLGFINVIAYAIIFVLLPIFVIICLIFSGQCHNGLSKRVFWLERLRLPSHLAKGVTSTHRLGLLVGHCLCNGVVLSIIPTLVAKSPLYDKKPQRVGISCSLNFVSVALCIMFSFLLHFLYFLCKSNLLTFTLVTKPLGIRRILVDQGSQSSPPPLKWVCNCCSLTPERNGENKLKLHFFRLKWF